MRTYQKVKEGVAKIYKSKQRKSSRATSKLNHEEGKSEQRKSEGEPMRDDITSARNTPRSVNSDRGSKGRTKHNDSREELDESLNPYLDDGVSIYGVEPSDGGKQDTQSTVSKNLQELSDRFGLQKSIFTERDSLGTESPNSLSK